MPFEVFLEQGDQQRGLPRWRWLAGLMTIPLHVGALLAVAIHSFWAVDEDGELKRVAGRPEYPAEPPTKPPTVSPNLGAELRTEPVVVDLTPVMLAPAAGISQRISDLSDPRFRPTLPPALNRPGTIVRGLFEVCVSVAGQVNEVKVLRSADPLVDGDWTTVIR